jgi:hypothetical protein
MMTGWPMSGFIYSQKQLFKMLCMETKPSVEDKIVGHNMQISDKECYIPSLHHFRDAMNNLKKSGNIF